MAYNCVGNCNCCPNLLKATSITAADGVTTINVAAGTLTSAIAAGNCTKICLGLYTNIPTGADCNSITVTDGTTTLPIYIYYNAQYWRPCSLKCRSTLVLHYYSDPSCLIFCRAKGRMAC